ncbi:tRNA glutamyl-Q(34) synthetase GluQRS [Psychrosphaera haliotis]|uniref:tRNA glutamyl-Q(34) synthetase GluQRS n=1 Tax=Psychrosphaera haliotis TaxID=555083 RepID=UPI002EDA8D94
MISATPYPFTKQKKFNTTNTQVRGRFAPSPSGPLHFGSLFAALGSYLHAKSQNGLWFVRIEDIDTTRVQKQAREQILEALTAFGFVWDCDKQTESQLRISDQNCLTQTQRINRYQECFEYLEAQHLLYGCECTRKEIKALGGSYNGQCKNKQLDLQTHPVRIKQVNPLHSYTDLHFGLQEAPEGLSTEDYLIKRRDGLFSYQLAVVVDDIDQGITHVVRGSDIMPLTARQLTLYQQFGMTPPEFFHLPVISGQVGHKLSKQNHATPIDMKNPKPELVKALELLGLPITECSEIERKSCAKILDWAIKTVDFSRLPKGQEILI